MATYRPLSRLFFRRYGTTLSRRTSWSTGPAPPRLPKEEQEVFERLQRQSTGAFSTPRAESPEASSPSSAESQAQATQRPSPEASSASRTPQINQSPHSPTGVESELKARIDAQGDGAELHPHVRRGAAAEFEGDRNPKTGEVGGPKNEPLRWGAAGDWSFNGRVTDF